MALLEEEIRIRVVPARVGQHITREEYEGTLVEAESLEKDVINHFEQLKDYAIRLIKRSDLSKSTKKEAIKAIDAVKPKRQRVWGILSRQVTTRVENINQFLTHGATVIWKYLDNLAKTKGAFRTLYERDAMIRSLRDRYETLLERWRKFQKKYAAVIAKARKSWFRTLRTMMIIWPIVIVGGGLLALHIILSRYAGIAGGLAGALKKLTGKLKGVSAVPGAGEGIFVMSAEEFKREFPGLEPEGNWAAVVSFPEGGTFVRWFDKRYQAEEYAYMLGAPEVLRWELLSHKLEPVA